MKKLEQKLRSFEKKETAEWKVEMLDLERKDQENRLKELLNKRKVIHVCDSLEMQVDELNATRRPIVYDVLRKRYKLHQRKTMEIEKKKGMWAYFPWRSTLVHMLPKTEYRELRMNRNRYKIVEEEQERLLERKIGVIGLSAGRSVATILALEGVGGHFRLADYDSQALSNLNRMRSSVLDIGKNKAIATAREIYEIDPYMDVTIYEDGINESNAEDFLIEQGRLDVLVEECDDLYVKIRVRELAKKHGIPVVMVTSERGMIDVERYDKEPERPLFHNYLGVIDASKMKSVSSSEKVPYVRKMIGEENLSERARISMEEIGKTIDSFSQLASDVFLGGATAADVIRRMMLEEFKESGRYFVDLKKIISDDNVKVSKVGDEDTASKEERNGEDQDRIGRNPLHMIDKDEVRCIVSLATTAPSGGNCQPWFFIFRNNKLSCYHDEERSKNFLNYNNSASYMTFGALIENIDAITKAVGRDIEIEYFPDEKIPNLVCEVGFGSSKNGRGNADELGLILQRETNRRVGEMIPITEEEEKQMNSAALNDHARLILKREDGEKRSIGEILGAADEIRILNKRMHGDMIREMRWSSKDAVDTGDGIDLETLELNGADRLGVRLISSYKTARTLCGLGMGKALKSMSKRAVETASAMGLVTVNGRDKMAFLEGGRALQRVWLKATSMGLAFQPMTTITYMFHRLESGGDGEYAKKELEELNKLRKGFDGIFERRDDKCEIMLFRIAKVPSPKVRSLRRPVEKVLQYR